MFLFFLVCDSIFFLISFFKFYIFNNNIQRVLFNISIKFNNSQQFYKIYSYELVNSFFNKLSIKSYYLLFYAYFTSINEIEKIDVMKRINKKIVKRFDNYPSLHRRSQTK